MRFNSSLRRRRRLAWAVLIAFGCPAIAGAGQAVWRWDGSGQTVVTALWPQHDSGFLVIVNNDASDVTIDINCDSRTLYLRRDNSGRGMFAIPPGGEFPVRVRQGDYQLYWGSGAFVSVGVRGNYATTLAFDVFGPGNTGLRAIVHDGRQLQEYTLYNSEADYRALYQNYHASVAAGRARAVVVSSTPVIVAEPVAMPPPPPVTLSSLGGIIKVASAIIGLFDKNKTQHDDRWGYNYQIRDNNRKRVSYAPSTVVTQPARPPAVVTPARPPVVVAQPKPPVVVAQPRPPVVVTPARPPVVVAQPKRPVVVAQPKSPVVVAPQPARRR